MRDALSMAALELQRMNKPREIEGVLDTYLIRPLGYLVVRLVRRTPVTPNMLSLASVAAAAAGAACYVAGGWAGAFGGLGSMLLVSAFDSADGQLARATGRTSDFGRTLDGLCDNFAFAFLYGGLVVSSVLHGLSPFVAFALALAGSASHSIQSVAADFVRLMYLRVVAGQQGVERERPELLAERLQAARGEGAGWLKQLILRLHVENARKQRGLLPSLDRLERAYDAAVAEDAGLAARFAESYRESHGPLLEWWAFMATNSHKVGVVLAAFVPLLVTSGWLATLGMVSYFAFVLLLNLPLALLLHEQGRRDRRLLRQLERSPAR